MPEPDLSLQWVELGQLGGAATPPVAVPGETPSWWVQATAAAKSTTVAPDVVRHFLRCTLDHIQSHVPLGETPAEAVRRFAAFCRDEESHYPDGMPWEELADRFLAQPPEGT